MSRLPCFARCRNGVSMRNGCDKCGRPIHFRTINGRVVPIPATSRFCAECKTEHAYDFRVEERGCWPARCPVCRESVFFIRHNGGSVWIDHPLGPPWYKHQCMIPATQLNPVQRPSAPPIESGVICGTVVKFVTEDSGSSRSNCVVIVWDNQHCMCYRFTPLYRLKEGDRVGYVSMDGPYCFRNSQGRQLFADSPQVPPNMLLDLSLLEVFFEKARSFARQRDFALRGASMPSGFVQKRTTVSSSGGSGVMARTTKIKNESRSLRGTPTHKQSDVKNKRRGEAASADLRTRAELIALGLIVPTKS